MIIDQDIQASGTLSVQQGPSINATNPDWMKYQLAADGLHLYMGGPQYSGAMVKIERPTPPASLWTPGKFTLDFSLCPDRCSEDCSQVYEHDIRITMNGMTYLFDMQNNVAQGGVLQVGTGSAWLDTGVKLGVPAAGRWTEYKFNCAIVGNMAQLLSVQVDGGSPIAVPSTFAQPTQSLTFAQPTQSLGWGDGVVFQNQRCFNAKGGVMGDVSRISIEWE